MWKACKTSNAPASILDAAALLSAPPPYKFPAQQHPPTHRRMDVLLPRIRMIRKPGKQKTMCARWVPEGEGPPPLPLLYRIKSQVKHQGENASNSDGPTTRDGTASKQTDRRQPSVRKFAYASVLSRLRSAYYLLLKFCLCEFFSLFRVRNQA